VDHTPATRVTDLNDYQRSGDLDGLSVVDVQGPVTIGGRSLASTIDLYDTIHRTVTDYHHDGNPVVNDNHGASVGNRSVRLDDARREPVSIGLGPRRQRPAEGCIGSVHGVGRREHPGHSVNLRRRGRRRRHLCWPNRCGEPDGRLVRAR
jgi:hypothetical protein